MANPAFWRALHGLAHPLTIISVVALVVNDHWLRWTFPSWLTGKLGDFVWLLFAPFLCALVLSWLIPRHLRQQVRIVGISSIGFIGAWFALAKTVPAFHTLTVNTLNSIVGWQGGLRMDATDLLTLPALFLSWHIWRTARNTPPRVPLGYVVTALGLMGTLATSCLPVERGIVGLCKEDDTLFAFAETNYSFDIYSSSDGGLTWNPESRRSCLTSWLSNPRFSRPISPYQVEDDGVYRNANRIFDLSVFQHDSYAMYHEVGQTKFLCSGPNEYLPGPLDALYDEQSGHLLLAMSHDGILLITGADNWQWVEVGDYYPLSLEEPESILGFLQNEFFLAFGLLMMALPTLALPAEKIRWYEMAAFSIGWGTWLLVFALNRSGYEALITIPVILFIIPLALFTLKAIVVRQRSYGADIMLIVLALSVTMLFLLPYALWVRRTVPNHGTASLFALVLVGGAMFSAVPYYRWRFPARKKKKQPDDDETLPQPIEPVDTYMVEDDGV